MTTNAKPGGVKSSDAEATATPRLLVAREIPEWQDAVRRAIAILERPHKHDWRPDLVTCGVEQDALGVLRNVVREDPPTLELCVEDKHAEDCTHQVVDSVARCLHARESRFGYFDDLKVSTKNVYRDEARELLARAATRRVRKHAGIPRGNS